MKFSWITVLNCIEKENDAYSAVKLLLRRKGRGGVANVPANGRGIILDRKE